MVIFNGLEVVWLEEPMARFGGVTSYSLKEAPENIQSLEHGYYRIDEQEFKIEKNGYGESIYFPMSQKKNMIEEWITNKWEQRRLEEEKIAKEEIEEWESDLDTELVFGEEGKAHLKNWKGKSIYLMKSDEFEDPSLEIFIDGRSYAHLFEEKEQDGKVEYMCYDGEPYRSGSTPKRAIEIMLKSCFRNHNEDDYEVSCTRCGDGGCPQCEPQRHIDSFIHY